MKILIVDDDLDTRSLIEQYLRSSFPEASIYEATNGIEGYHMAMEVQPDLTLTDLSMPVATGLDMIRLLRSAEFRQSIYVFSGRSELLDLLDESLINQPVFFKPIDLNIMVAAIAAEKQE
ncbi:MAG: response regulator transcription factor [Oligoflexus sp.]